MVFSSIEFLFFFLPVVLIGYYLLKRWRRAANVFLSVMSLGFYAFGAPKFFPIMMRSEERRVGKECRSRWSPYH